MSNTQKLEILIASDPYGYSLYKELVAHITENHAEDVSLNDFGLNQKYYIAAHALGREVDEASVEGRPVRGILCCGSGQGMAVVSNKFPRVFACCVSDEDQARGCRAVNNCNVLTLGGRVTGAEDAKRIVDVWLETKFTEGWAPNIQDFLRESMPEIASLDFNPSPSQTREEKALAGCTQRPMPIKTVKGSCRWRIVSHGGGKFRAICHIDKGTIIPRHVHENESEIVVLDGTVTVHDITDDERMLLSRGQYHGMAAGHILELVYHEDTIILLMIDGDFEPQWQA